MKHLILSIVLLICFSGYSAEIIRNDNAFYLENEKMRLCLSFEEGALNLSSFYNKEKGVDYLDGTESNSLFAMETSVGNFNSLDGSWNLSDYKVEDIVFANKTFGKKLELVLDNTQYQFSVTTVFEIYDKRGGLRYFCSFKNGMAENLLIKKSDVLNLKMPSQGRLYYVSNSNVWSEATDKIENAKMNCISCYDDHGWSLTMENNFATSLEEGGFKGDETQPFLFLNAFNGDDNVRVSTNPVAVQLSVFPNEEVEYFSVDMTVFKGDIIDAKMSIQEHMRERYRFVDFKHVIAINDWEWFSDGSRSDANYRNKYVPIAKRMGLDEIHVDDYWNCPISSQASATSRNSVTPEPSFTTDLVSLSEFIRNNGLELGLWYSLTGGWWGVGKDLANPEVQAEKMQTIEDVLIGKYHSTWQQIDLGEFFYSPENTTYSSASDNVYRKVLGAMNIMNTVAGRNPQYMLQMTPEADNNRARQGLSLLELPLNGIYGAYDRLDYNYSIQQIFQNFGILPFEGMMVFQYLNTFDASNGQLYSFLTGRHTSIYDKPDYFTDEMIERTAVFNHWRKNERIATLLNEVLRPVYFNVNDSNNGPYSWMFVNEEKTQGLLFAVAGANKNVIDLQLNIRWLNEEKTYHVFDISMDDTVFDYKYVGNYSGKELKDSGLAVNLTESQGRGKAFWIKEADGEPIEVLYVDDYADNYTSGWENGKLNVSVFGQAGNNVKVFAYKLAGNGVECKTVRIGNDGVGSVLIDAETITPATIRLKSSDITESGVNLDILGNISDYNQILLERVDGFDGIWNTVGEIDGSEYSDQNLKEAETYQYRLKLIDQNNVTSYSETLVVQTKGSSYWRQSLYDGFEDGYYDGWKVISGSWNVVDNNGNKVLAQNAGGDNWIYKSIENQNDYVLQVRVRLDAGTNIGIAARMDEYGDRYQFDFEASGQVVRLFRRNNTQALLSKPIKVEKGQWYTMSLKVDGDNIEASVNGELVLAMTDSECKGKGIGLYTYESQASFDDVSILGKESARIDVNVGKITTQIPAFSGNVLLPAGNMFDDTCDDFSKCRKNSGNLVVDNSMFIQSSAIHDENNPGKYVAWVEYEITPGSTVEFITRNADKGVGIETWTLMSSEDGQNWSPVTCSYEISPNYIADYWQIKTYYSTEIQSKYIRVYFPSNVSDWKAGLDAVSAFSMDGKIELLCNGTKLAETDVANDGSFCIEIDSKNMLPLGMQTLEFVAKNTEDLTMARTYQNVLVTQPLFFDDFESGTLDKWNTLEGECGLQENLDEHSLSMKGGSTDAVATADFNNVADFKFSGDFQIRKNTQFALQFGDDRSGFIVKYTGEQIKLLNNNGEELTFVDFGFSENSISEVVVESQKGNVTINIDGELLLSSVCEYNEVSLLRLEVNGAELLVDNVMLESLFDEDAAIEDCRINTKLSLDKNSISVSDDVQEKAMLSVDFSNQSLTQLPESLLADLQIQCKNNLFPAGTKIVVELFWNGKFSTFSYEINMASNSVWLTDIIGVNYAERPQLKNFWENLSTCNITYILSGSEPLETEMSVVAFGEESYKVGNTVILVVKPEQGSRVADVLKTEGFCYYDKNSSAIVINGGEGLPCQIYDTCGRLIYNQTAPWKSLNVSSWETGLYIVKMNEKVTKICID